MEMVERLLIYRNTDEVISKEKLKNSNFFCIDSETLQQDAVSFLAFWKEEHKE